MGGDGIDSEVILSSCLSGRGWPSRKARRAAIERHQSPASFVRGGEGEAYMNEKEDGTRKALLSQIALAVRGMVRDETAMATFRERIGPLVKRYHKYVADVEAFPWTKWEHWQRVKAEPQLRVCDQNRKPPYDGWIWDIHFGCRVPATSCELVSTWKRGPWYPERLERKPATEMPIAAARVYLDVMIENIKRTRTAIIEAGLRPLRGHGQWYTLSKESGFSPGLEILKTHRDYRRQFHIVRFQLRRLRVEHLTAETVLAKEGWWGHLAVDDESDPTGRRRLDMCDVLGCWRPRTKLPPYAHTDQPMLTQYEASLPLDGLETEAESREPNPPYWRRVPNPVDRFLPRQGCTNLPAALDTEEERERYYAVLASIHDHVDPPHEAKKIGADIWPKSLSDGLWACVRHGLPNGPSDGFLRIALDEVRAELPKPTVRVEKLPPRSKTEEKSKYVFRRSGSTGYVVAFNSDEQITIARLENKLPGLDYIHVLLRREAERYASPNRIPAMMSPDEVKEQATGAPKNHTPSGKPEKVMDKVAWQQAQERRKELTEAISDPTMDPVKQVESQEELDNLNSILSSSTRPGANGRPQSKTFADDTKKQRDAIRNAVNRAKDKIEKHDKDLAEHLRIFIKHGQDGHQYAPHPRIAWDLG